MAVWHGYGSELADKNQSNKDYSRISELHPLPNSQDAITFNETVVFELVRGLELDGEKNFMALFLLIIPVMTIFGNLLVVISVYRERALRTATNFLIISMAMADLLVALCVMPFAVYVEVQKGLWKLPKSLCTCYTAIDVCASTASILNLVAISWDRYMAVSKPIEYSQGRHRKNRRVLSTIAAVWFISIVIALPMVTGLNRLDDTPYCEFTNALYIIASSIASFFLPCLVMVGLYGVVLRKLREREEQRVRSNRNSRSTSTSRRAVSKSSASMFAYFVPSIERSTSHEGLGLNRVPQRNEVQKERSTIFATSLLRPFANKFSRQEFPESVLTTLVPSPRILTSSTPLTCPASTSSLRRKNYHPSIEQTNRKWQKEKANDWSHNNNNILAPVANNMGDQLKPFDLLDAESESVPFIDSSSVQVTPLPRHKMARSCNGTLKRLPTDPSSIFPSNRANSIAIIGQSSMIPAKDTRASSPLPRKKLGHELIEEEGRSQTPLGTRRHSIASFANGSLWPISFGLRFRDSNCFSEMLDSYRRRAGSCSAITAAAAKFSRQSRKERRATHTLAVVLVVFLCCWLPFFTCHMTNSICMVRSGDTCVPIVAFFFTTWLGYMNSFMNPVIYTLFNPEYRRAFKNVLCCQSSSHHR